MEKACADLSQYHTAGIGEFGEFLQTACENFTKFTIYMQLGIKMNWLDFEVRELRPRSRRVWERPKLISSKRRFENCEGHLSGGLA